LVDPLALANIAPKRRVSSKPLGRNPIELCLYYAGHRAVPLRRAPDLRQMEELMKFTYLTRGV
jgi:hypothetical protein